MISEAAIEAYREQLELLLESNPGDARVQNALKRIEEGTYGVCQKCSKEIGIARLNQLPYTPVCLRCAVGTLHHISVAANLAPSCA